MCVRVENSSVRGMQIVYPKATQHKHLKAVHLRGQTSFISRLLKSLCDTMTAFAPPLPTSFLATHQLPYFSCTCTALSRVHVVQVVDLRRLHRLSSRHTDCLRFYSLTKTRCDSVYLVLQRANNGAFCEVHPAFRAQVYTVKC